MQLYTFLDVASFGHFSLSSLGLLQRQDCFFSDHDDTESTMVGGLNATHKAAEK